MGLRGRTIFTGIFLAVISTLGARQVSASPQLDTIDTPTAATLFKGGYSISVWGYNDGGIFSRAVMGIHDSIFLGVSFDVQNMIGSGDMVFNIPGVAARFKFTDGFENFPLLIAAGYDAFYTNNTAADASSSWSTMRMIYGPYVVVTKPIFLLKSEQNISMGLRMPVQPDLKPEDTSLFLSINFPIGTFVPMFEIERLYFDSNRLDHILFNFGLRFELYEDFSIELNLMFPIDQPMSRVLTFEYTGSF